MHPEYLRRLTALTLLDVLGSVKQEARPARRSLASPRDCQMRAVGAALSAQWRFSGRCKCKKETTAQTCTSTYSLPSSSALAASDPTTRADSSTIAAPILHDMMFRLVWRYDLAEGWRKKGEVDGKHSSTQQCTILYYTSIKHAHSLHLYFNCIFNQGKNEEHRLAQSRLGRPSCR